MRALVLPQNPTREELLAASVDEEVAKMGAALLSAVIVGDAIPWPARVIGTDRWVIALVDKRYGSLREIVVPEREES